MRGGASGPVADDDTRLAMLTRVTKVEGDGGAAPVRAPGFGAGLRDGIPIALGYFTVSIAFGLAAAAIGFPTLGLALMSATNLSSSGQFAGVAVVAGGTLVELAQLFSDVSACFSLSYLSHFCRGVWWLGLAARDSFPCLPSR